MAISGNRALFDAWAPVLPGLERLSDVRFLAFGNPLIPFGIKSVARMLHVKSFREVWPRRGSARLARENKVGRDADSK